MKFFKKISSFIALVLLATTFSSHKTYTMEPEQPESASFADLSPEMQYYFIQLISTTSNATSLQEAGKIINALAQTTPELNQMINEPKFCLKIIKNLAKKFDCSDQEAAEALQTQEAKNRLDIQKQFLNVCQQNNFNEFQLLYEKYKGYVDLNFTFYMYKRNQIPMEEETFLTLAIKNKNCPFIKILLDYGTNIHQISRGKTPLMVAVFHQDITTIECLLKNPNIIINQQTNTGLTALIWAIFSQNKSIINLLLNAGADPEIANDKGNTPLQMAETIKKPKIIDLIQKAIDKKHKRQGK